MNTGAAPVTTPSAGTPQPPTGTPPSLTGAPPAPPAGDQPADPPKDPAAPPAEPPKEPDAPAAFAMDKIKLPDGMKADDAGLKSFGEVLANDKLSPLERGQALLDLYADVTKKGRDAATEAWNAVNKQWEQQTLADKDIGGAKWDAAKATIAKAIDSLGPDLAASVREALDVTGAGNHPAIVKAMHKWASQITEGGHIGGQPPSGTAPKSVKEAFYPNSPDMK